MLVTIAVALLLLWGAGLYTSHTLGGAIHILPLVAMVFIVVRINQGRSLIVRATPDNLPLASKRRQHD